MGRLSSITCMVLLVATAAAAQSARVTANTPIYVTSNPAAGQVPLRAAAVGTILKVVGEESGWVQVQFQDPQWGLRPGRYGEVRAAGTAPIARSERRPLDLSVRPKNCSTDRMAYVPDRAV